MPRPHSNPITSTSSATGLGIQRWRLWALLLGLALIFVAMAQVWSQRSVNSWAEQQALQATLREKVATLQVGATLASNLVPGALEGLSSARNDLSSVIGQTKATGRDMAQVEAALGAFDQAIAPVSGSSGSLARAAGAEAKFAPALTALAAAEKKVAAAPILVSGTWGSALDPIRQDLTRREIGEMPVIFAPIQGGRTLQRQWSDLFSRRARDLQAINDLAQKSPALDAQARGAVFEFAQAATDVAMQARALAETIDVRIAAQASSQDVIKATDGLKAALATDLGSAERPSPVLLYLAWALAVGCFLALVLSLFKADAMFGVLDVNSNLGIATRDAIDRLTRQFGRVLRMEGSQIRLEEPPDSPLFTLSSMTNRLIDWRDSISQLLLDQVNVLDEVRQELAREGGALETEASAHEESMEGLSRSLYADAEAFADIGVRVRGNMDNLQQAMEWIHRSSGLAQEGAWKNDSLRENAQGTAKRIKRMGESTQGITVATDFIREIARRILVLSVNGAIEAAGDNSERRQFGVIAEEIQRLAQNAIMSLKEIEGITATMQGDAKETVATMEESTAEVVAGGQLAARLGAVLKDLEKACGQAVQETSSVMQKAESAALQSVEVARSQDVQDRGGRMRQHVARLNELVGRTREMGELLRRVGKGAG